MNLPVVARLVPATSFILALRLNIRGRRDKPGDDAGVAPMWVRLGEPRYLAREL
jgi:hypothetical protein